MKKLFWISGVIIVLAIAAIGFLYLAPEKVANDDQRPLVPDNVEGDRKRAGGALEGGGFRHGIFVSSCHF